MARGWKKKHSKFWLSEEKMSAKTIRVLTRHFGKPMVTGHKFEFDPSDDSYLSTAVDLETGSSVTCHFKKFSETVVCVKKHRGSLNARP